MYIACLLCVYCMSTVCILHIYSLYMAGQVCVYCLSVVCVLLVGAFVICMLILCILSLFLL